MKSMLLLARLRHFIIISKWQRWLFPTLCIIPYLIILIWLFSCGLVWVAQVLLAPLLMAGLLALLTFLLAKAEFRSSLPRR